jgi:transposase
VTGGEAGDCKQLLSLMEDVVDVPKPQNLIGDAGYDSDANRQGLLIRGIRPVIKPNPTRKAAPSFDKDCYKSRNQIERMFNKLKQMRKIATRYDKTRSSFQGFISLAAIRCWLPSFVHTA